MPTSPLFLRIIKEAIPLFKKKCPVLFPVCALAYANGMLTSSEILEDPTYHSFSKDTFKRRPFVVNKRSTKFGTVVHECQRKPVGFFFLGGVGREGRTFGTLILGSTYITVQTFANSLPIHWPLHRRLVCWYNATLGHRRVDAAALCPVNALSRENARM